MFYDPIEKIYTFEQLASEGQFYVGGYSEIDERSENLKIPIFPRCTHCQTQITPLQHETEADVSNSDIRSIYKARYGCRNCQKAAVFFLQRENTYEAVIRMRNRPLIATLEDYCNVPEAHSFYMRLGEQTQFLNRISMGCLSCGYPIRKIQLSFDRFSGESYIEVHYCINNCRLRMYHRLRYEAGGFFLVPYYHRYTLFPEDTDPLEILEQPHLNDTQNQSTAHTQAEPSVWHPSLHRGTSPAESQHTHVNTENQAPNQNVVAPYHKKVKDQLQTFFKHTSGAEIRELLDKIHGQRSTIYDNLRKMIEKGEIRSPRPGYFERVEK